MKDGQQKMDQSTGLSADELDGQSIVELPPREAMSLVNASPDLMPIADSGGPIGVGDPDVHILPVEPDSVE